MEQYRFIEPRAILPFSPPITTGICFPFMSKPKQYQGVPGHAKEALHKFYNGDRIRGLDVMINVPIPY